MTQGSTRSRVLPWFVRGGTARTPDGTTVPIVVDPLVVGRDEGARIRMTDLEVSAIHRELRAVNEGVLVRDLGNTNGTFVGGLRVREGIITSKTEILDGHSRITLRTYAIEKS